MKTKYFCAYCGKVFMTKGWQTRHENALKKQLGKSKRANSFTVLLHRLAYTGPTEQELVALARQFGV